VRGGQHPGRLCTRLQPGVFSQVGRRVMMPGDVVASLAWLAFDIPWLLAYVLLLHRMLAGARVRLPLTASRPRDSFFGNR